ncbi:hypothetical protein [Parapedobacter tibetensis]|uniref:hypothetical protein n=1 Tax=Parapedobacter tibetensis TaxID=2972951 RepID=UPI00214DECF9|nr:hypothetical protein [Parapedobacter tibetensis]
MKKQKKVTGTQDKSRNMEIGSSTTDKSFKDTKTLKRHQGVPNAGGVRTGQTKNEGE